MIHSVHSLVELGVAAFFAALLVWAARSGPDGTKPSPGIIKDAQGGRPGMLGWVIVFLIAALIAAMGFGSHVFADVLAGAAGMVALTTLDPQHVELADQIARGERAVAGHGIVVGTC
jgi:uncharacterized membrane protein YtjA (UPF0391 family)